MRSSSVFLFLLTIRANAIEHDLMAFDFETVGIDDVLGQIRPIRHIHIEYHSALPAPCMVMGLVEEIVAIGSAGHLNAQHFALIGKHSEVAIDRRPRNVRMLRTHRLVHIG